RAVMNPPSQNPGSPIYPCDSDPIVASGRDDARHMGAVPMSIHRVVVIGQAVPAGKVILVSVTIVINPVTPRRNPQIARVDVTVSVLVSDKVLIELFTACIENDIAIRVKGVEIVEIDDTVRVGIDDLS